MHTLEQYLSTHAVSHDLYKLITATATAGKYINAAIRLRDTYKDGKSNASGDTQSTLDTVADTLLVEHLRATGLVRTIASEERDACITVPDAQGAYCIAFDPYDGGSVGDANITFGSIVGLWERSPLGARTIGTNLIASLALLYGPRVTLILALPNHAPALFEMDEVGTFLLVRKTLSIAPRARHIAPGNMRAAKEDVRYRTLLDTFLYEETLKLRYSGALVTDINHILLKGDGIFLYPADTHHPDGRLRLFYEGAPLAFLVECAGGSAMRQDGTRILDAPLHTPHQRTPLFFGSSNTITTAIKHFGTV